MILFPSRYVKETFTFIAILLTCSLLLSCRNGSESKDTGCRNVVDTIGFADSPVKMDTVMARIQRSFGARIRHTLDDHTISGEKVWKAVICPHDDYTYANYLYPLVLENVKAPVVILFGVAHKASHFGLEDRLVFGSFDCWNSAYGKVKISGLRDDLVHHLDPDHYIVHDSMLIVEHSLEAIVPFLQYYNPSVEIVPVLVPYMSFQRISEISLDFAQVLDSIARKKEMVWGRDFSMVISTDAVHYGDLDWGGSDFAFYGADSAGYREAVHHEAEIIDHCLTGEITSEKIRRFTEYTLQPDNYKAYRWTWCGRYAVPMGLMVGWNLARKENTVFSGTFLAYSTSIAEKNPDFTDIGMGVTAMAGIRHWVGYAAIGY